MFYNVYHLEVYWSDIRQVLTCCYLRPQQWVFYFSICVQNESVVLWSTRRVSESLNKIVCLAGGQICVRATGPKRRLIWFFLFRGPEFFVKLARWWFRKILLLLLLPHEFRSCFQVIIGDFCLMESCLMASTDDPSMARYAFFPLLSLFFLPFSQQPTKAKPTQLQRLWNAV